MNVNDGTSVRDAAHENVARADALETDAPETDAPRDNDRTHTNGGRRDDHVRLPDTDGYGHG